MATWARRFHRRAANLGSVVTSCAHSNGSPYPRRIEKVKFGVPLDQVCKDGIPGPLLVLILKLNKEAPYKKDIFRAPGHQGNMKKLIHFLQNGRLVNIDNFSTYTIASVLKKFLRKLNGGIFGPELEEQLFQIIEMADVEQQRDEVHRLVTSTPPYVQQLLVLLFGTFRVIATHAERAQTGMSSEALGVSVAPSFFHSCVSDGKQAKMEDVVRFKAEIDAATRIMKFLIDNFGVTNLFGRENYEYYARITGRVLRIEEEWIFSFRYPPDTMLPRQQALVAERLWLQQESERWGLKFNLEVGTQEETQSTPALLHIPEAELAGTSAGPSSSLTFFHEPTLRESCTRLSVSLEENGLFKGLRTDSRKSSSTSASSTSNGNHHQVPLTLEELKAINWYAESTKSLSYLPQVHERQTARMRTRSEWFLSAPLPPVTVVSSAPKFVLVPIELEEKQPWPEARVLRRGDTNGRITETAATTTATTATTDNGERWKILLRRTSSKERRQFRRGSSKSKRKNKENGNKAYSVEALHQQSDVAASSSVAPSRTGSGGLTSSMTSPPMRTQSVRSITDQDCTELDVQTFHVTLTYKPRI